MNRNILANEGADGAEELTDRHHPLLLRCFVTTVVIDIWISASYTCEMSIDPVMTLRGIAGSWNTAGNFAVSRWDALHAKSVAESAGTAETSKPPEKWASDATMIFRPKTAETAETSPRTCSRCRHPVPASLAAINPVPAGCPRRDRRKCRRRHKLGETLSGGTRPCMRAVGSRTKPRDATLRKTDKPWRGFRCR